MRPSLGWLILLLAALPSIARGEELARVLSPAPGAELAAGSRVTIEWEPLSLPAEVVEWEAFLSLDGGRTWPLRVTPHLDSSIRVFDFRVPAFPSKNVRMLLRFGDERTRMEEVEVEGPAGMSIVGDMSRDDGPTLPLLAGARGEKARSNDPGTVVWVEGSREGDGLREVFTWAPSSNVQEARPAGRFGLLLLAPGPARPAIPPPRQDEILDLPPTHPVPVQTLPRPAKVPLRLRIRRINE